MPSIVKPVLVWLVTEEAGTAQNPALKVSNGCEECQQRVEPVVYQLTREIKKKSYAHTSSGSGH